MARKNDEQNAINSLLSHLNSIDIDVRLDEDVEDNPDCLLHVDGKKIACECTAIGLAKIFRFHNYNTPWGEQNGISYPIEPFKWIELAIKRKEEKRPIYEHRINASTSWLILHDNHSYTTATLPEHEEHMRKACRYTKHGFEQIWLINKNFEAGACCLWNTDSDRYENKTLKPISGSEWPIQNIVTMQAKIINLDDANAKSTPENMTIKWEKLQTLFDGYRLEHVDGKTIILETD